VPADDRAAGRARALPPALCADRRRAQRGCIPASCLPAPPDRGAARTLRTWTLGRTRNAPGSVTDAPVMRAGTYGRRPAPRAP
jgi:hypothetical protein